MIALSLVDAALLYLVPILFLVGLWIVGSFVVYVLLRSPLDFDFKQDVLRKHEDKRPLPSGAAQLSFFYVAKLLLGDNCVQAVLLYRMSHFFAVRKLRTPAELLHAFSRFITHADLSPWATIGPGLYVYHGHGTVVGKGARIGRRLLICQGVSIGGAKIGDDVKLWAGAKVVGSVAIGDRSEVGANAVVIASVPADSIVFGVPARLAGKKPRPETARSLTDGDVPAPPPVETG
jgi:serine O-acetyltransferase